MVFWSVCECVCLCVVCRKRYWASDIRMQMQTKMKEKEKRSHWRVPSTSLGWCSDCKPFVKCVVYEFSSFAYKFLRKSLSLHWHHWQYYVNEIIRNWMYTCNHPKIFGCSLQPIRIHEIKKKICFYNFDFEFLVWNVHFDRTKTKRNAEIIK